MGRETEQTFFPKKTYRWSTGILKSAQDPQSSENANQNQSEISLHTYLNGCFQMSRNNQCWQRRGERDHL